MSSVSVLRFKTDSIKNGFVKSACSYVSNYLQKSRYEFAIPIQCLI